MDKRYRWERLTGSRVVSPVSVDIAGIVIGPTTGQRAIVTIYDGSSASDPPLMVITTATTESKVIDFATPLHTLRGLYIAFTAYCDEVLVCYDISGE